PPESPYVKIIFYAAFQNHSKRSCTRIVIRNSNGVVLGSRMIMNDHIPSAFAVEALACFHAVQMGLTIGFPEGNKVAHLLATEGMRSIDLSDTRGASIRCCDGKGLVVDGSTRLGVPLVDFLQAISGICSSSRD
ncbi:hypothetical protein Gotri_026628, partial [Gossypium trilobum]|nr:hypothetical protein [Gossypium trilobum]